MTKYKHFKKYVLRTPVHPIEELNNPNLSLEFFINNVEFLQAIKLASPSLYYEFKKWENHGLKHKKDEDRLLFSMMKYYIRSSMRCTPFGFFAGLNIGEISEANELQIDTKEKHKSHTRLDMNYLCSLIQDLEKISEVRDQLVYYVNNSLYVVGDKIRYVEYTYHKSKRQHQISAVEYNEYLQKVISIAKLGSTRKELVNLLVDNDICEDEAFAYIEQLIDNQVIVSNLDPTITGDELLDFLTNRLEELLLPENITLKKLKQVKQDINKLDFIKLGKGIDKYAKIANNLKEIDTKFEEKFLFQTDLVISTVKNTLNSDIVKNLFEGLTVLNKLTRKPTETNLKKFKEAFSERYEDREVSLALALDIEAGVGYLQKNQGTSGDNTPLVNDIRLPYFQGIEQSHKVNWDSNQTFLSRKYIQAIKNNKTEIEITDRDLKDYKENWNDLPNTFSVITELVKLDGEMRIILSGTGGSSAINLLGRFAHADKDLHNYTKEVAQKEADLSPNIILAEIVHLPESRVGNILSRPVFRKFEIPYLANSAVDLEHQIPLHDLMISVKQNRIVLRSQKLNKEVKPHLSNAHNFSSNALPVYQFLADMQTQNLRGALYFSWGILGNLYDYLPRVSYKNIILSSATWIIKQEEIKEILKLNEDLKIFRAFSEFKEKRNIPNDVILADGDNELYINLNSVFSIKMLLSLVNKQSSFKLKEFLFFEGDTLVKDTNGKSYTNQIVFSLYKEQEN